MASAVRVRGVSGQSAPEHMSLLRQVAAALLHGGEGLVARNRGEALVVIPGSLALGRSLDLEQVHLVGPAAARQNPSVAGEEVVDRQFLQFLRNRYGLVRSGRLHGLEILQDR